MATATINGFIFMAPHGLGFIFHASDDMSQYGYVKVMPHSFTVEIPGDFNPTLAKVESLKDQKEKLRDEFDRRVMAINEEISKLQCLEFDPQVTA